MSYLAILAASLFAYVSFWFVISLVRKRNDVADVAWGLGFVLMAWLSLYLADGYGIRGLVVTALVTVWGSRLAWHIHSRNKGGKEDYRYRTWREEWGKWFYLRSFFQVYLLQGALLFLIVLPVVVINRNVELPFGVTGALGIAIWLLGFFFEVVGDWQLARFIKNPANKGKLMTSGLWRYTRHPNYFGEVTLWWGIWLIALSAPYGALTIIGPLTITVLILRVSGVPMLEKKMAEHPDFAAYKQRTSVFIPWFRKSV